MKSTINQDFENGFDKTTMRFFLLYHFVIFSALIILLTGMFSSYAKGGEVDGVSYGGSGCPEGSLEVYKRVGSEDILGSFLVYYNEFISETGEPTSKRLSRKSCSVALPLEVPEGYQLVLQSIVSDGFTYNAEKTTTRVSTQAFFAGSNGLSVTKSFQPLSSEWFLLGNKPIQDGLVSSNCGEDVNLRINTSLLTKTKKPAEYSFGMIFASEVKLTLEPCIE